MLEYKEDRLPLTAAQSGIWFAQKLDPENPIYSAGEYLEIHGAVDTVLFESALRQTVAEAEALRVVLSEEDGRLWQTVRLDAWEPHIADLRGERDPRAAAEAWMRADLAVPVDPMRDPLFRFALFQEADDRFLWFYRYHHVVVDGYTVAMVARRVADVYSALVAGEPTGKSPFAPLRELVADDAAYRASEQFADDRRFWAERLSGVQPPVSLSGKQPRMARGLVRRTEMLSAEHTERLRETARAAGVPWPAALTAITAAYLQRIGGGAEAVLGMPVTTRLGRTRMAVPGMVSNVLPLRLPVSPHVSVAQLMRDVAGEMRAVLKHQRYRYEDLRKDLGLLDDDQPLVGPQVNIMMFDYDLRFGGHRAAVHNLSIGPADDLSIVVYHRSDGAGLQIDFDANPDLYGERELAGHLARFVDFLGRVGDTDPEGPLGAIDMVGGEDQSVNSLPTLPVGVGGGVSLGELFAERVVRSPGAVAVVCGDEWLSYGELDERSSVLAGVLVGCGVGPEVFVGVALERSVGGGVVGGGEVGWCVCAVGSGVSGGAVGVCGGGCGAGVGGVVGGCVGGVGC